MALSRETSIFWRLHTELEWNVEIANRTAVSGLALQVSELADRVLGRTELEWGIKITLRTGFSTVRLTIACSSSTP